MQKIEIKNISKKFGRKLVLDNISTTFEKNKIYGLLGRNGTGKSTLIKIIANHISKTKGDVFYNGTSMLDNSEALSNIYVMSDAKNFPEHMRIYDVFKWTKEFHPTFDLENAEKTAELFNLNIKKKVKSLSTGYTSIFKLIITLNLNIPFVVYDEPVLGLDANHRELFYKLLLRSYENNPHTIIIATHLIEEITNIIEHVVIIDEGKIIADSSLENLLSKGYSVSGLEEDIDNYILGKNVIDIENLGAFKMAYILGERDELATPENIRITDLTLQKLFVKLTNKGKK